jgi:hypothetical protein
MISILLGLLCFFPLSFLAFVLSERANAIHQSRVGKAISMNGFTGQSWLDMVSEVKSVKNKSLFAIYALQYLIVFFFDFDLESVFLIYLALNGFVLVMSSKLDLEDAEQRIEADRIQMRFLLGSVLAFISAFVCFIHSGSTSLAQISWSPFYLLFLPLFVVGGMITFSEYPFSTVNRQSRWIDSARFYIWCALAAQLFLGGSLFFIDLHLKAILLFVGFRLAAQYFPRYTQKDMFRLGVIYLIPIAVVFWLLVMIIHGVWVSGGLNA